MNASSNHQAEKSGNKRNKSEGSARSDSKRLYRTSLPGLEANSANTSNRSCIRIPRRFAITETNISHSGLRDRAKTRSEQCVYSDICR